MSTASRDLTAELDAFEVALNTPWGRLTREQRVLIEHSPLLEAAGKHLDAGALIAALRKWVA